MQSDTFRFYTHHKMKAYQVCMVIYLVPSLISCQWNKPKDTQQTKRDLHLPFSGIHGGALGGTAGGFSSTVNLAAVNSEPIVVSQRYTNTNSAVHGGYDYAAPAISAGNLDNAAINAESYAGSVSGFLDSSLTAGSLGGYATQACSGRPVGGHATLDLGIGSGGFVPSRFQGSTITGSNLGGYAAAGLNVGSGQRFSQTVLNGPTRTYSHSSSIIPRPVPVPVPQPVPVPVNRPYKVPVPQPVRVEVPQSVKVPVPQPYPVIIPRPVPVPITRPVPVPVPHPVPVSIARPIPVPVALPVPVRIPQPVPQPVAVPVDRPAFIGGGDRPIGNTYRPGFNGDVRFTTGYRPSHGYGSANGHGAGNSYKQRPGFDYSSIINAGNYNRYPVDYRYGLSYRYGSSYRPGYSYGFDYSNRHGFRG